MAREGRGTFSAKYAMFATAGGIGFLARSRGNAEENPKFLRLFRGCPPRRDAVPRDTCGLYNTSMSSDARGGIIQSGSSGSYTYSVKSGYGNMPVVQVSFYDAVRFANWFENGQPMGAQWADTL